MPRARKTPVQPAEPATRATTPPEADEAPTGQPEPGKPTIVQGREPQLTDAYLRALSTERRRAEFFGNGFGIRITPNGTKTWVFYYRFGGEKRAMTLADDPYPRVIGGPGTTLADAKRLHAAALLAVKAGIDPAAAQVAAKAAGKAKQQAEREAAQREADSRKTFRDVFDHWKRTDLKMREDDDGERSGRKDDGAAIEGQFRTHVFPRFGRAPIAEVTRASLLDLIDKTKDAGKKRTAAHLFAALRQMLDFAVEREYIDRNPLASLKAKKIVGKPKVRTRVLTDAETAHLLRRLPHVGLHPITRLALLMVLASGQRSGEVAAMRKADIVDGVWRIAPEFYKTNVEQKVPMSKLMQRVLDTAAIYNDQSAYVFPSTTNKPAGIGTPAVDKPIDRHSLSKALARKLERDDKGLKRGELDMEPFTPHDLRRTCRTGLAALGVPDHIAEKVLGHALQGVQRVYNQHTYLDERRAALDAWGEHLDALAKA